MDKPLVKLRLGPLGRIARNLPKQSQGFVELPQFAEDDRQINSRLGIVGHQYQGPAIRGLGFVEPIVLAKAVAQIEPRQTELRIGLDRFLIRRLCSGWFAPLLSNHADIVVRPRVIRRKSDRSLVARQRFCQPILLAMLDPASIFLVGLVPIVVHLDQRALVPMGRSAVWAEFCHATFMAHPLPTSTTCVNSLNRP